MWLEADAIKAITLIKPVGFAKLVVFKVQPVAGFVKC